MHLLRAAIPSLLALCAIGALAAAPALRPATPSDEPAVRAADARYWDTFNRCDLRAMAELLAPDVEFYHDKTGLTVSRQAVLDSLRKGPCADPRMKLRRAAVPDSVVFHPLAGGYALLTGSHRFYVTRAGEAEQVDGQAAFAVVWQLADGHWRMRRILSYDHGPVPYTAPAATLTLPAPVLALYAGHYRAPDVGEIDVRVEKGSLVLASGHLTVTLRPRSATEFFAVERDLAFTFSDVDLHGRPHSLTIREHGKVVATAARLVPPDKGASKGTT